jgi:hypothetical protein
LSAPSRWPAARAWPALAVWIACGGFFVISLLATPDGVSPASDSQHYADVARNLLRGNGFVIDFIEYHLGLRAEVRHVPEHHGMLRPFAIAPLFAAFGTDAALLRIPGLAYHALAGVVGFFLARRLFGLAAGVVATLLILGDVLLRVTALNGSDDMGFAFFCLCTVAALERGLRSASSAWFALAGLCAGLAVLEKQIGVFLPAVLVAPVLIDWRRPSAVALRRGALALGPFALCLAVYLVRNQLCCGTPGFGLYPLHLIFSVGGYEGVYRLFPETLAPREVIAVIGAGNVAAFIAAQFGVFARDVMGLPAPGARAGFPLTNLVIALGFASLALLARARPVYCLLCALTALGGLVFVAGMWHVDIRFFAFLVPLLAVALAGALTLGWRGVGEGWRRPALRAAAALAGLAVLVPSGISIARTLDAARTAPEAVTFASPCSDALAWLRGHTQASERVLSLDPWSVAWDADRLAIMAPAGGVPPIAKVVRHYGARFVLERRFPQREETRRALLEFVSRPPPDLRAARVFDGAQCDVIALERAPGARTTAAREAYALPEASAGSVKR